MLTQNSSGGCYNFANGVNATATDRALGFITSGSYTSPRSITYAFTNNTGQTITSITLSWNYEKYRSGSRAFDWFFYHGSSSNPTTAYSSGNQSFSADADNTIIFNPPSSISKSFTISGLNILDGSTYYLRWEYKGNGGSTNGQGLAIDNFTIAANRTACSPPPAQPTAINFSSIGVSSLNGSFTSSSPAADNYLVLASLDNILTVNPSNGTSYQSGDVIGDATVIQSNASTSFTASALNPATTYYFFVISYSSNCANGPLYLISTPLSGSATTQAGIGSCNTPINLATGISLSATATTISGSFTSASSVDEYLIVYSTSSTPSGNPSNGTDYVAGQSALGGAVVQKNNGTSFVITGLSPTTAYYVFIYSVNSLNCTGGPTYSSSYISTSISTAAYPLCGNSAPTAAPTALNLTITDNSAIGSFTAAAGADRYLVIRTTAGSLSTYPVNGQTYAQGATLGNGVVVTYTESPTFTAFGLSPSTTYYFFIFSVVANCSGAPNPPLYYATPLQGNATTISTSYYYYFGNFHSHTGYSDGSKDGNCPTPTEAYNFAKTATGMDFLGVSEHNHAAAGGALSTYLSGITKAAQFNATSTNFLALFGMEWGTISGGGHVLVYGDGFNELLGWDPNEYSVYVPKSDYTSAIGLFKTINDYSGNNALAILAHPSNSDYQSLTSLPYSSVADDAIVGVALETGPAFSTNTSYSDPGSSMAFLSYYRKMLSLGYRVGPVIDHDNHYTTFGKTTYSRTAVIATSLTRNSIINALRNMRFYATQDYDTKVEFKINGRMMGSDFRERFAPTIYVNIADETNSSELASAVIKLMSGTPGSGVSATQLTSAVGGSLQFVNTAQLSGTTVYYYLDITIGTKRIITSPIWFTRDDFAALPVKLSSFNVRREGISVQINWTTEQEISASHFVIERSSNSRDWDSLLLIAANGSTPHPTKYQVYDHDPATGVNYYRLRQVSLDGKYDYSLVRRVLVQNPEEIIISPNPSYSNIEVKFLEADLLVKKIQILNFSGKILLEQPVRTGKIEISLSTIQSGAYILRAYTTKGIKTRQFLHFLR